MKQSFALALIVLTLSACGRKSAQNDSMIDAKVDSIVGTRMEEINRRAMEDLDQRMTIEVKAKADSIIAARKAAREGGAQTPPAQ